MSYIVFQIIGAALILAGLVSLILVLIVPFTYSANDEEEGPK